MAEVPEVRAEEMVRVEYVVRAVEEPATCFAAEIEKAGFSQVQVRKFTGGVAAIHSAFKI